MPPTTAGALLELSKKIKDLTQRVEQAERTIFKQDCELERLRNPEYAHFDRARQRELSDRFGHCVDPCYDEPDHKKPRRALGDVSNEQTRTDLDVVDATMSDATKP